MLIASPASTLDVHWTSAIHVTCSHQGQSLHGDTPCSRCKPNTALEWTLHPEHPSDHRELSQRHAAGSCHCPRDVFPTIQQLLSSHTSRRAQPFPILAAQHPSIVLRRLFPHKNHPQLPQRCSRCSLHPLPPPRQPNICHRRGFGKEAAQITAAVGMWFQYFPLHPSSPSPGYTKHLPKSEPLNCCCKRCNSINRSISSAWLCLTLPQAAGLPGTC